MSPISNVKVIGVLGFFRAVKTTASSSRAVQLRSANGSRENEQKVSA